MKHFSVFIICVILFFSITGCQNPEYILPSYEKKECFYGNGFQDYTDYFKYYYNVETINDYKNQANFKKVTSENINILQYYFSNFKDSVAVEQYFEEYDFDYQRQIKLDDYFLLVDKKGYSDFELYYVDMEKCILYYICRNT